jgi:hypothetical protein
MRVLNLIVADVSIRAEYHCNVSVYRNSQDWYSSLKRPGEGCASSFVGADRRRASPDQMMPSSVARFGIAISSRRGWRVSRVRGGRLIVRGYAVMSDQRITSSRLKFGWVQLSSSVRMSDCCALHQRWRAKPLRTSPFTLFLVAGARGFEPRLTDPKTGVLPLDDAPTAPSCPKAHWAGCSVPNGSQTVKKNRHHLWT